MVLHGIVSYGKKVGIRDAGVGGSNPLAPTTFSFFPYSLPNKDLRQIKLDKSESRISKSEINLNDQMTNTTNVGGQAKRPFRVFEFRICFGFRVLGENPYTYTVYSRGSQGKSDG